MDVLDARRRTFAYRIPRTRDESGRFSLSRSPNNPRQPGGAEVAASPRRLPRDGSGTVPSPWGAAVPSNETVPVSDVPLGAPRDSQSVIVTYTFH